MTTTDNRTPRWVYGCDNEVMDGPLLMQLLRKKLDAQENYAKLKDWDALRTITLVEIAEKILAFKVPPMQLRCHTSVQKEVEDDLLLTIHFYQSEGEGTARLIFRFSDVKEQPKNNPVAINHQVPKTIGFYREFWAEVVAEMQRLNESAGGRETSLLTLSTYYHEVHLPYSNEYNIHVSLVITNYV